MTPSEKKSALKPRMAYLVSQFPVTRETFIAREVLELERQGIEIEIFAIKKGRANEGSHDFLRGIRAQVYHESHLSPRVLADLFELLFRSPQKFLEILGSNLWERKKYPLECLKFILLFPKMIHYSREMLRRGLNGANACWSSFPGTFACVAHELSGLRYCITCRAWDLFVPFSQAGLKHRIDGSSMVRVITDYNAAFLEGLIGSGHRSKVRRNPSSVEMPQKKRGLSKGPGPRYDIIAGGSLIEKKGLKFLVEALAHLKGQGISISTGIVGDGPLKEDLEGLIQKRGLEGSVHLLGRRKNEEFQGLMVRAKMFVLPCVQSASGDMDGIPNVLMEAMALGVPVISTRLSGIPELIKNGDNGLLVPAGDAMPLALAIERLYRSAPLRRRLGSRAPRAVRSGHDLKGNVRDLISYYREFKILPSRAGQ